MASEINLYCNRCSSPLDAHAAGESQSGPAGVYVEPCQVCTAIKANQLVEGALSRALSSLSLPAPQSGRVLQTVLDKVGPGDTAGGPAE